MTRLPTPLAAALLTALAALACQDATTVDLLEIEATGVVFGQAFLDNDGNELPGVSDAPLEDIRVLLTSGPEGAVVRSATTGPAGDFVIRGVPLGSFRLTLDEAALGDSLLPLGGAGVEVRIERGDTVRVDLGASFPVLTVAEVRSEPPGRRVFTSGIALNSRLSFGDGVVHLGGESAWLRSTNVARSPVTTGDSVRFLGRTGRDAGQPVLRDVTPFLLVDQAAIPFPLELTSAEASTARQGAADAALVRVRRAAISDTGTVDGSFRFTVDDGSGPLEVLLRPFLQVDPGPIRPDTVVRIERVTGLLVPVDDPAREPRWRLLPRSGQDISLELKRADLGLAVDASPRTAASGETVEITVVVSNAGPASATGVAVADTVPAGLTLLAASATAGSYDADAGLWTVGSLEVGARDTLRLVTEVVAGAVGSAVNRAFLAPLVREVDPDLTDNAASVAVTLGGGAASPPATP